MKFAKFGSPQGGSLILLGLGCVSGFATLSGCFCFVVLVPSPWVRGSLRGALLARPCWGSPSPLPGVWGQSRYNYHCSLEWSLPAGGNPQFLRVAWFVATMAQAIKLVTFVSELESCLRTGIYCRAKVPPVHGSGATAPKQRIRVDPART